MKTESVMKNMEYLVKELHKEWDRSGAVTASVFLSPEAVEAVAGKIREEIRDRQTLVEGDTLSFRENVAKSKECYILLRVVRQMIKKKAADTKGGGFSIERDKEELKLFKGMFAELFK